MSLSAYPVETVVVQDPRIDFDDYAAYLVEIGAGEINYHKEVSSNVSNSSMSFNYLVPSRITAVSPKVHLKVPLVVTITPSAGGNFPFPIPPNFALRFDPIMQACATLTLQVENATFTQNINEYYNALMRFNSPSDNYSVDWSTFPSQLDSLGQYYEMAPNTRAPVIVVGSGLTPDTRIKAPFARRENADYRAVTPRLSWNYDGKTEAGDYSLPQASIVAQNTVTFTYLLDTIVPISPLYWGHKEMKGLVGVNKIGITLNFDPQLAARMICSAKYGTSGGANINANIDIQIGGAANAAKSATAEFIELRPRADYILPQIIRYPYNRLVSFNTGGSAPLVYNQATGNSNPGNTTINAIQLDGVPKKVYIFARKKNSELAYYKADCFARIRGISMTLGSNPGLFADATEEELYRISVKNGLKDSWLDWCSGIGSVFCIDFGQDVPLGLTDAPGSLRQMKLSYTLQYNKINSNVDPTIIDNNVEAAENFDVYTVISYDGVVIVKNGGSVVQEINDVAPLDVIKSMQVRQIPYDLLNTYAGGSYTGGDLKSALESAKSFVKHKVAPGIQKALPYAKKGVELVESLLPMLLAAGYSEEQLYELVQKKQGGAKMSKASLKTRARK